MTEASKGHEQETRVRIDKFAVPSHALGEFVGKMKYLQEALRTLPGCRHAAVLTQVAGPGRFNVLTLVEWESQASVANATEAMQQKFKDEGFDPKSFTERLGIEPDLGLYAAV